MLTMMMPSCHGPRPLSTRSLIEPEEENRAADNPNETIEGHVVMTDGTAVPWTFSITSKGNGLLDIANLRIRVYDDHDDGVTFNPWLLRSTVFEDSNGRCSRLELIGTRVYFDEKDAVGPVRHAIHVVCQWDSATKTFSVENDPWGIVLADRNSTR